MTMTVRAFLSPISVNIKQDLKPELQGPDSLHHT